MVHPTAYDPVLIDALRKLEVDQVLIHEMLADPLIAGEKRRRYSQLMQNINYQWKPKRFVYVKSDGKIYVVRVA